MNSPDETGWKASEELLTMLMEMGISKIAAEHALFYTGNNSAEAAASYVFDNFENDDLDLIPPALVPKVGNDTAPSHLEEATETDGDHSVGHQAQCTKSYKMVFVVNSDLNMGVGKIAAQVAHASLGLYRTLTKYNSMNKAVDSWIDEGEKKIVLKGTNHIHLQELQKQAELENLYSYLIHDAGRTQIPPNSVTVLALFGEEIMVNNISGSLKLL